MAELEEADAKKPYQLRITLTFTRRPMRSCSSVEELWQEYRRLVPMSMFRGEPLGVSRKDQPGIVFPVGTANLTPGTYNAVIETMVDDETMEDIIGEAIAQFKRQRPLVAERAWKLELELLTSHFTHASLTQEGSTITLAETVLLAKLLENTDPLHNFEDKEWSEMVQQTTSSEVEVVEAINHLQIVRRFAEFIAAKGLTEGTVLGIHKQLMDRLLVSYSRSG